VVLAYPDPALSLVCLHSKHQNMGKVHICREEFFHSARCESQGRGSPDFGRRLVSSCGTHIFFEECPTVWAQRGAGSCDTKSGLALSMHCFTSMGRETFINQRGVSPICTILMTLVQSSGHTRRCWAKALRCRAPRAVVFIHTCHRTCAPEHKICPICHQSFRRCASPPPWDIT